MESAFLLLMASLFLSIIFTPKSQNYTKQPEALADLEFPQADEGTPQAVFFGECWTSDWAVLGVGNYRTTPIISGGGKK
jgi:hypothetical protein